MVDINGYISSAIDQVFRQNQIKYNVAKQFLSQYSGDTKTLLEKLGSLCNCDFTSLANLHNVAPSQAVNDAISSAGGPTLSGTVCGKVGTLGSFYSCTSLTDAHPTLIATGSELCAAKEQAKQKCANYAFSKLVVVTNISPNTPIHPDYGDPSQTHDNYQTSFGSFSSDGHSQTHDNYQTSFGSFSSDGHCFSIDRPGASYTNWNSAVAADTYLLCLYALDH